MPQIQLDEQVFQAAQRRAAAGGYASVDQYIAEVLTHDLTGAEGETPDLDHLFTPQRLGEINAAAGEIKAGNYLTSEQARDHFKKKSEAWNQKNGPC